MNAPTSLASPQSSRLVVRDVIKFVGQVNGDSSIRGARSRDCCR